MCFFIAETPNRQNAGFKIPTLYTLYTMFFLKKNPPSLYIEKVHFNPPSIVIIHHLPVKKIWTFGASYACAPPPSPAFNINKSKLESF